MRDKENVWFWLEIYLQGQKSQRIHIFLNSAGHSALLTMVTAVGQSAWAPVVLSGMPTLTKSVADDGRS